MSHFTTIDIEIKDIEALKAACAEMALAVVDNTEARGWGSARARADHVIKLQGPYDIAVNRQADGYELNADLWGGHVEREVGSGFGRLKQLYGVHKTINEARQRRLSVRRQNLPNGQIRLALCQV
jgi:hypothetical protein